MKQQVTGAYLDGIAEGRRFLKANSDMTLEDMQHALRIAKINVTRHSYAMKDCFKGERDFWKNQIKKKGWGYD